MSKFSCYLATGFGLGKIKSNYVPTGTLGALIAIPVWWILISFFSYKVYFIFLIFGYFIGIYCCDQTNKLIGVHDHKSIIWDEFIGMGITLIVVPLYHVLWIIVAFLLFRILDIIKPWPISWLDRSIKGGFGVIIDDVFAGVISMFIILFLMKIIS